MVNIGIYFIDGLLNLLLLLKIFLDKLGIPFDCDLFLFVLKSIFFDNLFTFLLLNTLFRVLLEFLLFFCFLVFLLVLVVILFVVVFLGGLGLFLELLLGSRSLLGH